MPINGDLTLLYLILMQSKTQTRREFMFNSYYHYYKKKKKNSRLVIELKQPLIYTVTDTPTQ